LSKINLKTLKIITISLGLLSVANVILLGIYIINCYLVLTLLIDNLYMEVVYVGFATLVSVSLIIFGCYSINKNHFLRGGISNLVAGIITTGIYLNYTLNLAMLQKFDPLGYFLSLPPLINGIIGIITSKV